MATSEQLRVELVAVLVRYRRRISDRGGVVPEACVGELVAVAERHTAGWAPDPAPVAVKPPVPGPGRRQVRRPAEHPA
ncbi:MAG TPA: hypothetical protein VEO01_40450 [Pseudonocardiaceae bacterium]|nr:hypothetical protein [Pseudonocardiaceae bacterium]